MEINVGGRGGGKTFTETEEAKKRGRPACVYKACPPPGFNKDIYMKHYITRKIKMLQNEFHLKLTEEEIARFWELGSDVEVDKYAHKLFLKYL